MIKIINIIFLLYFIQLINCKMTVEQMFKTAETVKQVCQPKFKLTDEQIAVINQGQFPDNRELKCYVNCFLEMMQTMKKGKINYESSIKQIDMMMPDEYAAGAKSSLEICKNKPNGIKDNCDASYVLMECFYNNNPKFFFP